MPNNQHEHTEVHDPFFDPFTAEELQTIQDRAKRESRVVIADDYKRTLRDFAHAAATVLAFITLMQRREDVAELRRLEEAAAALEAAQDASGAPDLSTLTPLGEELLK